MSQALGCAFVAVLASARPPGYGGEIVSYVYGPPLTQDPATAQTAADAAAHSAAFEPLYARQGEAWVPVLASGPPRITSTTVEIPLRTDVVRHDNIAMTPAHVVDALLRLENIPHAAYVLSPLLRREGRPAISVADDEPTVVFELDYPDASFIDLLSADHARLAWPSESGPMVGTGPFRWQSPSELRSFLQHRDGRPYIDNIVWRPYASRFGATALAERGEALIFGGPKPPRVFAGSGAWLVLQIGPTIGDAALRDGLRR
ncbi:MAG: ABC transporter substrate-binding protein, partial [Myxococcota bacterium]